VAFDDVLDEVREALRRVRNPLTGKYRVFNTDQLRAASRAVEFMRSCRITGVTVHVDEVDGADGKEPSWYYKCRLRGRMEGAPVTRSLVVTSDPMGQLLRREGDFHPDLPPAATTLKGMVPKEQWDALAAQLAEWGARFERDSAADLQERIRAVRDRIFQKDRGKLTAEMARLQRRGWKLPDVVECWNEALVEEVMKA